MRASKNIAYLLQQIADADTVLFPVWQSGIDHADRMANVLSAGIATVVPSKSRSRAWGRSIIVERDEP